jgi:adenylylsulfate kinase
VIIWLTGVSGSGKTTLSKLLKDKLIKEGYTVEWYDGDRVREELKIISDFSREGILKNNHEIINRINKVKGKADFIIISLITPYQEVRNYARKIFGNYYFEVYIKCDKKTLIERDTKGLYKKALDGEIDNLIGFNEKIPYEEPANPDLVLETNLTTPESSLRMLYNRLNAKINLHKDSKSIKNES